MMDGAEIERLRYYVVLRCQLVSPRLPTYEVELVAIRGPHYYVVARTST